MRRALPARPCSRSPSRCSRPALCVRRSERRFDAVLGKLDEHSPGSRAASSASSSAPRAPGRAALDDLGLTVDFDDLLDAARGRSRDAHGRGGGIGSGRRARTASPRGAEFGIVTTARALGRARSHGRPAVPRGHDQLVVRTGPPRTTPTRHLSARRADRGGWATRPELSPRMRPSRASFGPEHIQALEALAEEAGAGTDRTRASSRPRSASSPTRSPASAPGGLRARARAGRGARARDGTAAVAPRPRTPSGRGGRLPSSEVVRWLDRSSCVRPGPPTSCAAVPRRVRDRAPRDAGTPARRLYGRLLEAVSQHLVRHRAPAHVRRPASSSGARTSPARPSTPAPSPP